MAAVLEAPVPVVPLGARALEPAWSSAGEPRWHAASPSDAASARATRARRGAVIDQRLDEAAPDAPPIDGDAIELLPVPVPDVLPEVEPVPVAPIELVLPELDGVVDSEPVLPVVVLLPLIELEPDGEVDDGEVDAVDGLVDDVEPGVELVVEDVLDSRLVQAPSERATTASTPAVSWVMVIFIGKLLERSLFAMGVSERAAAAALPRL